jgi:hypothetical protein
MLYLQSVRSVGQPGVQTSAQVHHHIRMGIPGQPAGQTTGQTTAQVYSLILVSTIVGNMGSKKI